MAGYPEIDDEPAHASRKWLTEVLRQELGFDGVVVSEGYGFQTLIDEGIVPTQKEAGALALHAGVDQTLPMSPLIWVLWCRMSKKARCRFPLSTGRYDVS